MLSNIIYFWSLTGFVVMKKSKRHGGPMTCAGKPCLVKLSRIPTFSFSPASDTHARAKIHLWVWGSSLILRRMIACIWMNMPGACPSTVLSACVGLRAWGVGVSGQSRWHRRSRWRQFHACGRDRQRRRWGGHWTCQPVVACGSAASHMHTVS